MKYKTKNFGNYYNDDYGYECVDGDCDGNPIFFYYEEKSGRKYKDDVFLGVYEDGGSPEDDELYEKKHHKIVSPEFTNMEDANDWMLDYIDGNEKSFSNNREILKHNLQVSKLTLQECERSLNKATRELENADPEYDDIEFLESEVDYWESEVIFAKDALSYDYEQLNNCKSNRGFSNFIEKSFSGKDSSLYLSILLVKDMPIKIMKRKEIESVCNDAVFINSGFWISNSNSGFGLRLDLVEHVLNGGEVSKGEKQ